MKYVYALLILSFCCFLTSCQSYHVFMASQSMGPEQVSHMVALSELNKDKKFERKKAQIYICEYYAMELGGFSTTCKRGDIEE